MPALAPPDWAPVLLAITYRRTGDGGRSAPGLGEMGAKCEPGGGGGRENQVAKKKPEYSAASGPPRPRTRPGPRPHAHTPMPMPMPMPKMTHSCVHKQLGRNHG
jgi:hypothetical protein